MQIAPSFLEKLNTYPTLKYKLSHVFNRDVYFIVDSIIAEAQTLPIENSKFTEIEIEFEIKAALSMSEITDKYCVETTLKDYMFLEPEANNTNEFIALLSINPRNHAIVKAIVNFRKLRNRCTPLVVSMPNWGTWGIRASDDISIII